MCGGKVPRMSLPKVGTEDEVYTSSKVVVTGQCCVGILFLIDRVTRVIYYDSFFPMRLGYGYKTFYFFLDG